MEQKKARKPGTEKPMKQWSVTFKLESFGSMLIEGIDRASALEKFMNLNPLEIYEKALTHKPKVIGMFPSDKK